MFWEHTRAFTRGQVITKEVESTTFTMNFDRNKCMWSTREVQAFAPKATWKVFKQLGLLEAQHNG
jgi:hypothetical protein